MSWTRPGINGSISIVAGSDSFRSGDDEAERFLGEGRNVARRERGHDRLSNIVRGRKEWGVTNEFAPSSRKGIQRIMDLMKSGLESCHLQKK
jgi:hypothetical protein